MWVLSTASRIASIAAAGASSHEAPQMDSLMLFGFLSTFFTLVFFIYQHESRSTLRMFAICLAVTAIYGFLEGSWALGIVVAIWSIVTFRRSSEARPILERKVQRRVVMKLPDAVDSESRISRMFGPI